MNDFDINRVQYCLYTPFMMHKERIDTVLSNPNLEYLSSIDDIIELCSIVEYIKRLNSVNDEETEKYKSYIPKVKKTIGLFFSKITQDNWISCINGLPSNSSDVFWEAMCSMNRDCVIRLSAFKSYLDSNPHHLNSVLRQKDLVCTFANDIYLHLKENIHSIKTLISDILEDKNDNDGRLYIKSFFSSEQLKELYDIYINFEEKNPNILRLIKYSQNDPILGIDDEIRLKAKNKETAIVKAMIASPSACCAEEIYGVSFRESNEIIDKVFEDGAYIIIYDRRWIQENPDYPTLLNNFIYLFGYTDLQFRSNFPVNGYKFFEYGMILGLKGRKMYDINTPFSIENNLFALKMESYIFELQKINIDIEGVFKWFFEEYIQNEFSISGFSYYAASAGTTYLEKCKNISSEMERVLKQYRLLSIYGYINSDLFEMSSEHIVYSNLKTLQKNKYVYCNSDKIKNCIADLFGNVMMCYTSDNSLSKYCNLYEAFKKQGRITKIIFNLRIQKEALQRLVSLGVIIEKDKCYFLDMIKGEILRQLYEKEVLCYNYCSSLHCVIDELLTSGELINGDTLFSIPEQQYLDYILNKKTYSNGLDLKNKYSHGTTSGSEDQHHQNYLELLKIMVLIIIKINEELILLDTIKKE